MNKKVMNKVFVLIEWIARIVIVYFFAIHGLDALLKNKVMLMYFTHIGISYSMAIYLLPLVGILDLVVASLIIFRPFKLLVIWAMIWPIIPGYLELSLFRSGYYIFFKYLIIHCLPGLILYTTRFTKILQNLIEKIRGVNI